MAAGTEFAMPEQAFAPLESMMNSYEKEGAGISSVKNVAGKVRYAVIEMPQRIVCCWVNKQRKNSFSSSPANCPRSKVSCDTGDLLARPVRQMPAGIAMSVMQRREGVIEHVIRDEPALRDPLGLIK